MQLKQLRAEMKIARQQRALAARDCFRNHTNASVGALCWTHDPIFSHNFTQKYSRVSVAQYRPPHPIRS